MDGTRQWCDSSARRSWGRPRAGAPADAPHPWHRVHPYLLWALLIDRPTQVWCADITYIPMRRGFLYLVAVMDWATREVLGETGAEACAIVTPGEGRG